jgi:hypothetical protein
MHGQFRDFGYAYVILRAIGKSDVPAGCRHWDCMNAAGPLRWMECQFEVHRRASLASSSKWEHNNTLVQPRRLLLRIWIDYTKSGVSPSAGLVFTITLEESEVVFIQIVHGMVVVIASYYLNQNFSRRHPQNVPRTGITRDVTWHSCGRHLRLHDPDFR